MTKNKTPMSTRQQEGQSDGQWSTGQSIEQHALLLPSRETQDATQLLTRQFSQLSRERSKWNTVQAERMHALQEFSNTRRFFNDSVQSICATLNSPADVDIDALESMRRQLVDDGERVSAKSECVQNVEKQATSTEWSMHRIESEIAATLMALVPSYPAAAEWVRVMNESQVDCESFPREFEE